MNIFSKLEDIAGLFYKLAGNRCNCENSKCAHEAGNCGNEAGSGKVMDIGSVCDECLANFSPEYILNEETSEETSSEPTEEDWKDWEKEQYKRWINYSEDELRMFIMKGRIRDFKFVRDTELEEFENKERAREEKEKAQAYFNGKTNIHLEIKEVDGKYNVYVDDKWKSAGSSIKDALINACIGYWS